LQTVLKLVKASNKVAHSAVNYIIKVFYYLLFLITYAIIYLANFISAPTLIGGVSYLQTLSANST